MASTMLLGAALFGGAHAALADDKALIDANTQRALTWMRSSGGNTWCRLL